MKEIYIIYASGLTEDDTALEILRNSGIISGIELSNINHQFERVKSAGLKVSCHTPGSTLNLAKHDYANVFYQEQGTRLISAIRRSDAATVGFHCGYSAEEFYKMISFPNVPKAGKFIKDRNQLLKRIIENILLAERRINFGIDNREQKLVVIEPLDYTRERPVPWEIQNEEATTHREEIESTLSKYGINSGILYVTDPSFVRQVLDGAKGRSIKPVGLLFDVAHTLISADTKIHEHKFKGTIEDYFGEMTTLGRGRTYQLHLGVPEGDNKTGYSDAHGEFKQGERLSDYIIELAREILRMSPEINVITLEIMTGLSQQEHAKKMIKQAEYLSKKGIL